jgi:periplasmic protein TonB
MGSEQQASETTAFPVLPPRAIKSPAPKYPSRLRGAGVEGTVLVWVSVDEKGRTFDLTLKKSSGYDEFDRAALEGIRKWKFKPATKDGVPVTVRIDVVINFKQ